MRPNQSATNDRRCPQCQAVQLTEARQCWLCGETLPTSHEAAEADIARSAVQSASVEPTSGFSLASLMMFMTLACVVLGVSTLAPGLGVPFGIVVLVIWLRTVNIARQRQRRGAPMTRLERVQFFLSTAGFLAVAFVLVGVAAGGALFTVCFTICAFGEPSESFTILPFALGAAAITAVAIIFLRWLFRHKSGPNVTE
jgi:hypothetical protein